MSLLGYALNELAKATRDVAQSKAALDALKKGLSLKSPNAHEEAVLWCNVADSYGLMGNKKEQIKAAQRATEIDDSYEAWLHLANAYVESRMAEEAFATLRRLYAMNPRDADVLNNLGLISIMVHKDKVSAARYAEELQSVDPVRAAELLSLIRR